MDVKLTLNKEEAALLSKVMCKYSKGTKYGEEDFETAHKLVDIILTAQTDALAAEEGFVEPPRVDLCMTNGADCVLHDDIGLEETARRFREYLEGEIFPGGGGPVFVSWAGYRKGGETQ